MRNAARVGLCLALGLAAGCVAREDRGGLLVFTYSWWVGALAIAGGLLSLALALALPWGASRSRRRRGRMGAGAGFGVIGVLVLALVAPTFFGEEVIVAGDGFRAKSGPWFAPSTHEVLFSNVKEIRYATERYTTRSRGHARSRTRRYLECTLVSGAHEKITVGGVLGDALPDIVERAEAAGVKLTDVPTD